MNKEEIPITHSKKNIVLNDIGFRLILIPFFGIAIPLITGIIDHRLFTLTQVKLSYLYMIGLSWLVWEGNRFLLFTLRNYFDWFEKPMRKIFALLLVIPFYTIPITVLMLVGWYHLFNIKPDWPTIKLVTLIFMVCIVFIVHIYETVFLVKEAESEKTIRTNIEKATLEVEIQVLKSQLDPHFMFNTLNTLSHFIDENPVKAKNFNEHLCEVYRYLLNHKNRELVWLWEELDFIENYFALLKLRFEDAIALNINLSEKTKQNFLILPISIQLLVENAIKHNSFSDYEPLVVSIKNDEDVLEICNTKRDKPNKNVSSGLGLSNLQLRYALQAGKDIEIIETANQFSVKLPILKA